jgi:hypothetical protein
MKECKHKKDKYGCIVGCKLDFPVISRKAIIAEAEASEQNQMCECEHRCDKCGKLKA